MKTEIAVLAGGCFWGVEDLLRRVPGVIDTEVGYTGGEGDPTYENVKKGKSGYAESIQISRKTFLRTFARAFFQTSRSHHYEPPRQRRRYAIPFGDLREFSRAEKNRARHHR
jgi:peptide methionine sulfoxide reductase MsrA